MLNRRRRLLRAGIAALLLALAGAFAAVLLVGQRLSQPARQELGPAPASLQAGAVTFDGGVRGWFSPGKPGAGAVLLLHGVRGNRGDMLGRARFLHEAGHAVVLIDLPGHGESEGERISFGMRESAGVRAAMRWLQTRLPQERIGVIGVSLGAAAFVLAEIRPAAAAVVLESMYPTIAEAVTDRLDLHLGPWARPLAPLLLMQLPWRLGVSADALRPIEHLPRLGSPLLIVSGAQDRHTRRDETERLFAVAREPKQLWIVEGAAHVDLHAFDRSGYEGRVGAFLGAHLRQR